MISYYSSAFYMSIAIILGWKDTYEEKINLRSWKFYAIFILLAIGIGVNYKLSSKFIRFIIATILLFFGNLGIFRKSVKQSIISTIIAQGVMFIAEMIFAMYVLTSTTIAKNQIPATYFGTFYTNVSITTLMIFMTVLHMPNYFYKRINKQIPNTLSWKALLSIMLLILSMNFLFTGIYFEVPLPMLMITGTIIIISYGYIIIYNQKVQKDKLQVDEKYLKTSQRLNECQKIIDEFHRDNHETTTQIENMKDMLAIQENNYEKYFEQQLRRKKEMGNKISEDKNQIVLSNSPLGVAIRSKCKEMKDSNIKYQFELDKAVSFVIMTINVLFSSIYYQMPLIISMVLNTIIMTIYGYIILKIMNEHNENLKVFEKYKKTAESLNEYQDTVNKYRLDRHENKNQLETIEKLAIRTNNQEILEYVQVLLDKKNKNKPQVKIENIVIPDGWLETTLYTKMETMEEKKIKYNLSIDKLVKTTDLIDIDESTMLDICNILNIFMDNAIEAVADHRKGNIKIRFYKETKDYLNISVINSCKRMIDIGKIGINGYSDKGDGRGYGLACVKETIRHNKRLLNETVVKEESFTQILKIKM